MKKDNRGFSLIEMIVVIALLGILVGGSVLAYSVVHSATVSEVAETIGTGMAETRAKTMTQMAENGWKFSVSAVTGKMSIIKDTGGGSIDSTDTKLDDFSMSYRNIINSGFSDISYFDIVYETETGAVKKIVTSLGEQTSGTGVLRITVDNKTKDIYIYFATGKYETK